jgi:carboxypeptidase C (cathepsin A)
MFFKVIGLLLSLSPLFVTADKAADKVEYLPGMDNFTFNMYSGFLAIDGSASKSLHYLFAESQGSPSTDPLVIWFNGGPGCSSLLGFI